jgi:probable rRNA maturation factor
VDRRSKILGDQSNDAYPDADLSTGFPGTATEMNSATDTATTDRDEPDSSAGESDQPPEPARSCIGRRSGATADIAVDLPPDLLKTVDGQWLRARLSDSIGALGYPVKRVAVSVVDDETMRQLHRRFMGLDESTDVLTFPAASDGSIDVDIAVCADEARRQAADRGHDVTRELLLYALHGLLHCAGFDDHDDAGFDAMHAEEDRILDAIGVGMTFGRAAGRRSADA